MTIGDQIATLQCESHIELSLDCAWTLGIGQLDIMDNAHSNEIPRVQLSAPMEDCTAMQRTLEQIAFYRELLQLRQPSHTS